MAAFPAAPQELCDQRRLSNSRLARYVDSTAAPLVELFQRELERGQLGITPEKPPARFGRANLWVPSIGVAPLGSAVR
jgi:hypothetical protein